MSDTTTAAPPEPLGLDDVTEADIRRTLQGNIHGKGGRRVGRTQLADRVREQIAELERTLVEGPGQLESLRGWLKREGAKR